jgi:hypothetical protein
MGLKGAVAAGEFTPSGQLVTYKGELTEEIAEMIAQKKGHSAECSLQPRSEICDGGHRAVMHCSQRRKRVFNVDIETCGN